MSVMLVLVAVAVAVALLGTNMGWTIGGRTTGGPPTRVVTFMGGILILMPLGLGFGAAMTAWEVALVCRHFRQFTTPSGQIQTMVWWCCCEVWS